ncbi:MAG: ParB N-terminal domain-containing protein [Yaniella sp.]|nr:ParB N-terminal domain-containing protein [Yaniella sp.]
MNKPVLFQNMPPLSPEEYSELEASIKEHGIQVPILIDEDGVVIDGHHRQKIAQELGIRCPKRQVIDKTESEKRTLALSLNVHRRHLTREQKRALIAESIKADPQLPDLQHAHRTGASPHTVKSVRTDLESDLQIANDIPRVNARGQERPASYDPTPVPKSDAELLAGAEWVPAPESCDSYKDWADRIKRSVNVREGRDANDDDPMIEDKGIKCATGTITGMDGKTYTRPEPKEHKPKAEAITSQFSSAIVDLNRVLDRFHRISTNDNFQRNKSQIEALHGNDLARAISELQNLADQLN